MTDSSKRKPELVKQFEVGFGVVAFLLLVASLVKDFVEQKLGVTQTIIDFLLISAGSLIATGGIAWVVGLQLKPAIENLIEAAMGRARFEEYIDKLGRASADLGQHSSDLAALLDKFEESQWYYPYRRFFKFEDDICKNRKNVHIYIVSTSMKYDTDDTLLPVVKHNISKGASYHYLFPEGTLQDEIDKITGVIATRDAGQNLVADRLQFVPLAVNHPLVAAHQEIAAFEYEVEIESAPGQFFNTRERDLFLALHTNEGPKATPWARLRDPQKRKFWDMIRDATRKVT